jgi:hypothetical protein
VATHELQSQERWATGNRDDREDEHDGTEPDEDGEPMLGSVDRQINQEISWHTRGRWWLGGDDQEVDTSDNEPSLGAGEVRHGQSQELWGYGGRDDREDDPAELGYCRRWRLGGAAERRYL